MAALVLTAVLLITYCGVLWHGFVHWDDDLHITDNESLNPPRWSSVARFWLEPYEALYIPLSYTFFAGEVVLADAVFPRQLDEPPHPLVFKSGSLVLHGGCAFLVWLLLCRWTGRPWGSLLGAVLFAVHPVQVESVAWTSEQRGLLSAGLGLSALWLHPPARGPTDTVRPARWREPLALLLFAAGLLAKPTIVVIAPIVFVGEMLGAGTHWRQALWRSWPWWCLAGAMTLLTQSVQSAGRLPFDVSLLQRLQIACDSFAFHVLHGVWPWPLGIDYGRTPDVALNGWLWWLGLIGLAAAGWLIARGPSRVGLAVALFVLGLLPTLGLQPFAFQTISTVADRYAYLALLGPVLGFALLTDRARSPARLAMLGGVLIPLAAISHWQVNTWRTDETLFRNAIAVNPRSHIAWNNLGQGLHRNGDSAGARAALLRAIEIAPRSSVALYNLGVEAERQGNEPEAGRYFEQAAEQPEARPQALIAWARWLGRHNRQPEALEWYRQTLESYPRHVEALTEYAGLLHAQGETDKAKPLLEAAIAVGPTAWSPRVALGHILLGEGNIDRATKLYGEALRIRDDLPEPLLNLGLLKVQERSWDSAEHLLTKARAAALRAGRDDLAAAASRELVAVLQALGISSLDIGGSAAAIEWLQRACELDPTSAAARFHLGRAYLMHGDATAAREALTRALGLVPADSEPARDIRTVLKQAGGDGA
ncbi:MAG: tetratricopeptide repeat protein [Planctomycetaceae bacterium]|nr:tetratricopeptide repeat protein [Planctomycetaceae bacterium]